MRNKTRVHHNLVCRFIPTDSIGCQLAPPVASLSGYLVLALSDAHGVPTVALAAHSHRVRRAVGRRQRHLSPQPVVEPHARLAAVRRERVARLQRHL